MPIFRHILAGWDGSETSARACAIARELGGDLGADVTLLTVLPPVRGESEDDNQREMQAHRSTAMAELSSLATRGGRAPDLASPRPEVVEADYPAETLQDYAEKHQIDLLVVGRHGVNRALHPRMGRVTEDLVFRCCRPVLVVSDPSDDEWHRPDHHHWSLPHIGSFRRNAL